MTVATRIQLISIQHRTDHRTQQAAECHDSELHSLELLKGRYPDRFEGIVHVRQDGTLYANSWKGNRTYQVEPSQQKETEEESLALLLESLKAIPHNSGEHIKKRLWKNTSTIIHQRPEFESLELRALGDLLSTYLREDWFNIVDLSGHGGKDWIAGMRLTMVDQGFGIAQQRRGIKPKAISLNGCETALVTNLLRLSNRTPFIIATGQSMGGFPLTEMLESILDSPHYGDEAAVIRMARSTHQLEGVNAIAINTEHVASLASRYQTLLETLRKELDHEVLLDIIHSAIRASRTAHRLGGDQEDRKVKSVMGDFGKFVKVLIRSNISPAVKKAAEETLQILEKAVVAKGICSDPDFIGLPFNAQKMFMLFP